MSPYPPPPGYPTGPAPGHDVGATVPLRAAQPATQALPVQPGWDAPPAPPGGPGAPQQPQHAQQTTQALPVQPVHQRTQPLQVQATQPMQAQPGPGEAAGRVVFQHLSGSRTGQVDDVVNDRIGVGRDPALPVSFDAEREVEVSANHAHLWRAQDGYYYVVDCGSRNGTYLNGQRIADTVPVVPQSVLRFGANGPEVRCYYQPLPSPHLPTPPRYG